GGPNFPEWANIDASGGMITGTPPSSSNGLTSLSVSVKDSAVPPHTASASYLVWIDAILSLRSPLATATRFVPYSGGSEIAGGVGPFSVAAGGGTLPPGMNLSVANSYISTLLLIGTPTHEGTFNFTVQITDSA